MSRICTLILRTDTAGGFAYIFGRRPVMIASILLFALGSALCGAAQNVDMMIAGRTVQGAGGGGISTLVSPSYLVLDSKNRALTMLSRRAVCHYRRRLGSYRRERTVLWSHGSYLGR